MYNYDGIVEEFEDYLDYAADKRFEKKPEELFDKYADWPEPEDIVKAKNSGTYAQLKRAFCDDVKGDGYDKGGM